MSTPVDTEKTVEVLYVFTFHDHFFKLSRRAGSSWLTLEDEYGTTCMVESGWDLNALRDKCGEILQEYRVEMSLSEAAS